MAHTPSVPDRDHWDISELSEQLKLLALNTVIESTSDRGTAAETALRIAALKRLLGEVQTAMSWYRQEATETEALARTLADLTQRVNQTLSGLDEAVRVAH